MNELFIPDLKVQCKENNIELYLTKSKSIKLSGNYLSGYFDADIAISKKSKDGKFGHAWVTPAMCRKGAQYCPYAGWDLGWTELSNNEGIVSVNHVKI